MGRGFVFGQVLCAFSCQNEITNWLGLCVFVSFILAFSAHLSKCLDCHIQLSLEEFGPFSNICYVFLYRRSLLFITCATILFFGCLLDMECIVLSAFSDPQLFAMRSIAKTKRKKNVKWFRWLYLFPFYFIYYISSWSSRTIRNRWP